MSETHSDGRDPGGLLPGKGPGGLTDLLYIGDGGTAIQPFSRNIFLMRTAAAGCHHVDGIRQYLTDLSVGKKLTLLREPDNPFDELAILIMDGERKLGYIPRRKNEVLARLMDAGKYLYAVTEEKLENFDSERFYYAALTVSVYMQD